MVSDITISPGNAVVFAALVTSLGSLIGQLLTAKILMRVEHQTNHINDNLQTKLDRALAVISLDERRNPAHGVPVTLGVDQPSTAPTLAQTVVAPANVIPPPIVPPPPS